MNVQVKKFLRPVKLPEILPRHGPKNVLSRFSGKFFPPVPEVWAAMASIAGGRYHSRDALLIGLLLWRESKFSGGDRPVKLTKAKLRALNIGRYSASNALVALEKFGLITVQRFKHRSPLITIVTQCRVAADLQSDCEQKILN